MLLFSIQSVQFCCLGVFFFFCSFLAKRGVREDIATFEARNIPTEIRQSVEQLLQRNKASFDPKVRFLPSFLSQLKLLYLCFLCHMTLSYG